MAALCQHDQVLISSPRITKHSKMRSITVIFLSVFVFFQLAIAADTIEAYKVPANFPWNNYADGTEALYMTKDVALLETRDAANTTSVDIIAIPWFAGYAWQAFNLGLTAAGIAGTIQGCVQNDGTAASIFYCVTGLLATIIGIGGHASAAKTYAKGFFAKGTSTWSGSGLENIALDVFSKRDFIHSTDEYAQHIHNSMVYHAMRSLTPDVEFLGYAGDSHRLAKRDADLHPHPYAPVFRLRHDEFGAMDIVSRDVGASGMHFTVAFADHPTHIKRAEFFQHERVSSNLVEARFSLAASQSDTHDISFNAGGAFNQLVSDIHCFTGGKWKTDGKNVLNVQMYDKANKETFGFASLGFFAGQNSQFQSFTPTGQPVSGGETCPGNS